MITIAKGKEKIKCSYKTYEEQFKQLGYLPISEEKKVTAKIEQTVEKEEPKEVVANEETVSEEAENKETENAETANEETANEEDKIGAKYGVRRRTSTKKED